MHIFPANFSILLLKGESAAKYFLKYQKPPTNKPSKFFYHIARQFFFRAACNGWYLDIAGVLTVQ